jgi:hypothetical protein
MKAVFRPMKQYPGANVEALTVRYKAAFDQYQRIVDRNMELTLTGGRPSPDAALDEERAFDELDAARHALLDAAALVSPTLH